MWEALAMLLGTIVSAAGSYFATSDTNQQNTDIHSSDNAFNAEQAAIANRRDRKNMVDAAGLQMQGLERAGVNPLLAITNGVSQLPKASAATAASPLAMESYSPMFSQLQSGFSGAIQASPQMENVKADTQLKQAQANRLAADTEGINIKSA